MERKGKIIGGILFVLFVCVVVWTIRTTPDAPSQDDKIDAPKTMEYTGNTISEEKDGKKIWELDSEKMVINTETQNAELENITGRFYQEDDKILILVADKGNYNQNTKDIHVEGNVAVVDEDTGAKLVGGKVDWLNEKNMLVVSEEVKISKDDMRAFADKAASKNGFQSFFLRGHARILKGVKNGEEPTNDNMAKAEKLKKESIEKKEKEKKEKERKEKDKKSGENKEGKK